MSSLKTWRVASNLPHVDLRDLRALVPTSMGGAMAQSYLIIGIIPLVWSPTNLYLTVRLALRNNPAGLANGDTENVNGITQCGRGVHYPYGNPRSLLS